MDLVLHDIPDGLAAKLLRLAADNETTAEAEALKVDSTRFAKTPQPPAIPLDQFPAEITEPGRPTSSSIEWTREDRDSR